MAEKKNTPKPQQTSNTDTDLFVKGMTKDPNAAFAGKEQWTHARNAINNSIDGDVGTLGNEPANIKCGAIPYTVIGAIHLYGDKWIIFSTNDTISEIGSFDDSECKYKLIVNDTECYQCQDYFPDTPDWTPCLNFNKQHLITGAAKENFDCSWQVYWDDGINPSRTLNLNDIPWKRTIIDENAACIEYEIDTPACLDCERLRLAPLVDTPCVELSRSPDGGQLRNGSYQAFIAYTINDQVVGDYYGLSNIQALFAHEDNLSGLELKLSNLDKDFEYFSLVICSNNQMEMQAKQIGIYSTQQENISIDYINQALKTIPIEVLPLRNPAYERSDNMYVVNDYLIRQGPTEQFDFNYQPLANNIHVHWVSTEFPSDYYKKGGNKPTFMRDEVYAFFIRFIYNTGEKSSSFHIPGRPPLDYTSPDGTPYISEIGPTNLGDQNIILDDAGNGERVFETYNTGWIQEPFAGQSFGNWQNPNNSFTTDDGGLHIVEGHMGYWESTERYPQDPVRWNGILGNPDEDLCGQPIRHHRFPSEDCNSQGVAAGTGLGGPGGCLDRSSNDNQTINVLGIRVMNVRWPRFNAGSDPNNLCEPVSGAPTGPIIPNIVGYEILVGSREGNRSIIAKGLTRNMREYDIPANAQGHESELGGTQTGLISNYPFNDLNTDPYLCDGSNTGFTFTDGGIPTNATLYAAGRSRNDCFTFHSPDTSFNKPFLSPYELKSYGVVSGTALGRFKKSEDHPQQKLLRNLSMWVALFVGIGYALAEMRGKRNKTYEAPRSLNIGLDALGNQIGGGDFDSNTNQNIVVNSGAVAVGIPPASSSWNSDLSTQTNIANQTANSGGDWEMAAPYNNPTGGLGTYQSGNLDQLGTTNWSNTAMPAAGGTIGTAETGMAGMTVLGGPKVFNQTPFIGTMAATRTAYGTAGLAINQGAGVLGPGEQINYEGSRFESLPSLFQLVYGIYNFMCFAATGGQEIIELIYNLVSYQDYAWKYNAHGLYFSTQPILTGRSRTRVEKARYIGSSMQQLTANLKINNIQRPSTVAIKTDAASGSIVLPSTIANDNSKFTIGNLSIWYNPTPLITSDISAHYCGLKVAFKNQYGQLDQIRQVPIRGCVQLFKDLQNIDVDGSIIPELTVDTYDFDDLGTSDERMISDVLYGGDCYIARYTEKVIMPFFWDFLVGQPDGYPYDYRLRANVPRPKYWMNTQKYDMSMIVQQVVSFSFMASAGAAAPSALFVLDRDINDYTNDVANPNTIGGTTGGAPSSNSSQPTVGDTLGGAPTSPSLFHVVNGFMYTHCSGINDIFVETPLNIDHRDWEDADDKRFYDWTEFTDVNELFDAKVIKRGNFYKYDNSLGKDRFFSQLISFGMIQPRDYDPIVSANCYTHYPKRLIYSLQAQKEAKKDFWRVFLPNNYKDFKNKVSIIKPISKSGALILFPNLAPQMFQGVDQLQTDLGTKLTIGDGGLFGNPMQNIVNTDLSYEYGSCESQRSVINTPSGLFYISQAQGKVFQYTGEGLVNIANNGMKQWFNKYLPSMLLDAYPGMEDCQGWVDNPVVGVGCQSVYDPNYDIVYFCKKDYEPVTPECIDYVPCQGFVWNNTNCGNAQPRECCPEGYIYNAGGCPPGWSLVSLLNGTLVCIPPTGGVNNSIPVAESECCITWEEAAIEGEHVISTDLDIVFAIDGSNSINGENNVGNMQKFVNDIISSFGSGLSSGNVQIGLCHYGVGRNTTTPLCNGQVGALGAGPNPDQMFEFGQQQFLTSDINDLNLWVGTQGALLQDALTTFWNYVPDYTSKYGQAVSTVYSPGGHDIIGGIWSAQNLLYGSNSRNVKKVLITITEDYQNNNGYNGGNYQSASYTANGVTCTDIYQSQTVNPPTPDVSIGNQDDVLSVPPYMALNSPSAIWFNNNVLMNIAYNALPYQQENYSIAIPNLDGQSSLAIGQHDYNAQFADMGNSFDGNFNDWERMKDVAGAIIQSIGTTSQYYCEDPECVLTYPPPPSVEPPWCVCQECVPVVTQDDVSPISLDDTDYFTDVSWTVSYDPKSKTWISFHDWHPELVLPSLNHFFTTKTTIENADIPAEGCPPGFTWNPTTMTCCQTLSGTMEAIVTAEETSVDEVVENAECLIDIVIGVDVSGSTAWPQPGLTYLPSVIAFDPTLGVANTLWEAQVIFAWEFIQGMAGPMNAGNVQISQYGWGTAGAEAIVTPGTQTFSDDPNDTGWYDSWGTVWGGGTWMAPAFNYGQSLFGDVWPGGAPMVGPGGAPLGDRTKETTYKRLHIFITDGTNASDAVGGVVPGIPAGIFASSIGLNTSPAYDGSSASFANGGTGIAGGGGVPIDQMTLGIYASPGGVNNPLPGLITSITGQPVYGNGNGLGDPSNNGIPIYNIGVNAGNTPAAVAWDINQNACFLRACYCPDDYVRINHAMDPPLSQPPYLVLYDQYEGCTESGAGSPGEHGGNGICRKITCECDETLLPTTGSYTGSLQGDCPTDIPNGPALWYDSWTGIGDAGWENEEPQLCNYTYLCCVDADFKKGGIWKHNDRCDLFANYYDHNYPWEVEWVEAVGQTVNTIRSVEYQLESYIYKGNLDNSCGDRFHDLDWNFDHAIIYNTEQVSGNLTLVLDPKNNVPIITQYPIITPNDIQILYSKEEQKYRFNMFWDITTDRGEFDPNANSSIFITQLNGYIRDLNAANLNYFKPAFQRKRFRHYWNKVILRKDISADRKMLLKLANTKINTSFR